VNERGGVGGMRGQSTQSTGAREDIELGELDPQRRATLLESQAEELRQRLDALLDEIARHHRRSPADLMRRYAVPAACTLVLAGAGLFFLTRRLRHRREVWVRLSTSAQSQLHRLLSS
jgi:hypothetical protein